MTAINLEYLEHPDVVALDKDGNIILIIEVQGFPFDSNPKKTQEYSILRIIDYLKASPQLIPLAMFVDLENILIFHWDGFNLLEIIRLKTGDILSHYEPEFNNKQIFNLYLTNLVKAWINDFCYHWKSEKPPAFQEIKEINLLPLLEGGITQP
ncbi:MULTISPECIES: hypothetical protein [unclassified Anabaena]|uniref:hypothetical protein n=1 Tax=unclassified Anabaena TaxID=2619674 RepID=UPI0039C607CC